MANDRGYICLHRSLQMHWLWQDSGYLHAWIDMLMMAQWEDREKTRLVNSKLVATHRGQLIASLRFMAKRWGWTMSRTRTFVGLLESDTMIAREIAQGETVISILKYDEYNTGDRTPTAREIAHKPHTSRTQAAQIEEGETSKQEKKITINQTRFDEWWKLYPKKVNKKAAKAKYLTALAAIIKRGDTEQALFDGLGRSPQLNDGRDVQYMPGPDRWLNAGGYDDEAGPLRTSKPAKQSLDGYTPGSRSAADLLAGFGGDE